MANFLRDKSIKYLNKDFDSLKRDLIEYTKAHHSGVFQSFNEASPGMALLELNAYVGDVLSYYMDQAFNELKQETARQEKNVVSFAKSLGYKPKGNRAARGTAHFILEVPATTNTIGEVVPDDIYSPIVKKGARLSGPNSSIFETLDNVSFSSSFERDVTGSQFDSTTGLPTHFALRKSVPIVAGETTTDSVSIGAFEQFKTIELSEKNVLEIISVTDSDGNEWVEVDYLAQNMVFDDDVNTSSDSSEVPYILRYISVPRRFIVDRNPTTNKTSIIFGSGDGISFDDELIPNLADLALPLAGRATFTSYPLDPQNFIKTRGLGLSPFNTTLTINYRTGGGLATNVAPGTIKSVSQAVFDFSSTTLNASTKSNVEGSLEVINLDRTDGGGPPETISEIKANSAAYFATQNRTVTAEDYIARTLSIPEKFGKPDKVFVKKSNTNSLAIDLHVLSRDSNNHLTTASTNLKNNIKTYLEPHRMLTDGVNILDAKIINLKMNFGIVVGSKFNRSEILAKCLSEIKNYFDTNRQQIGQPIIISDLSADLQSILGVISVYEIKFSNAIGSIDGLDYSTTRFDVRANTNNNIIYCPDDAIFEIKYPNRDLSGVAK